MIRFVSISIATTLVFLGCAKQRDMIATGLPLPGNEEFLISGEEKHLNNVVRISIPGSSFPLDFDRNDKKLILGTYLDNKELSFQIYDVLKKSTSRVFPKLTIHSGGQFLDSPSGDKIVFAAKNSNGAKNIERTIDQNNRRMVINVPKETEVFVGTPQNSSLNQITKNSIFGGFPASSNDGSTIAFNSLRNGDHDIYLVNSDGTELQQISDSLGFEFDFRFDSDQKFLYFSAYYPRNSNERKKYVQERKIGRIHIPRVGLYKIDLKTKKVQRVFPFKYRAHSPSLHVQRNRLLFVTNMANPNENRESIFAMNLNGKGLEQIKFSKRKDLFPTISNNGKRIAWASSRRSKDRESTDVFIANWQ